jgi:hypothetical protein
MSVHMPTVQPRHLPTFPNLAPFAVAAILVIAFALALLLIRPFAVTTTASTGTWMTEHRQGEITLGTSGAPAADVLVYRAGEINAANE